MRNQHYFINHIPRLELRWRVRVVAIILFCFSMATFAQEENWMPDPELRQAVREALDLPQNAPLIPAHLQRLTGLVVLSSDISNLQGLEHAKNLRFLHIADSKVRDLAPLKDLVSLEVLKLWENKISDVAPLAKLTNLEELHLSGNEVRDISPLATLINLRKLYLSTNQIEDVTSLSRLVSLQILDLEGNLITDITPLKNLVSLEFVNINANVIDESQLWQLDLPNIRICDLPRLPVKDRIGNREYPSVFSAWQNIINLPSLSWNERLAYHDLRFTGLGYGLQWRATPEGVKIFGDFEFAKEQRDTMLSRNPNMLFLVTLDYYAAHPSEYPEDSPFWLRDESGNRIEDVGWSAFLIDFTLPEAQDYFVKQAIEIAKCGLYDGIFLDWWRNEWHGDELLEDDFIRYYARDVGKAAISLLRRIRDGVNRDDFLIIVNTNRSKIPRSAPYVNGTFMETIDGRHHAGLAEMESTLLWSEQNFRYPQINCLEGWGDKRETLDSPTNQRWMRVFTTLSLTHSDGYVNLVSGIVSQIHTHLYEMWDGHFAEHARGEPGEHTHQHYWYDFWDADLGRPVGEKGVLYLNREGLYIREFTNGWAVYNRSGKAQQIQLSESTIGVSSGIKSDSHTLPDLDGEIYLKSTNNIADLNSDDIVNILDLVIVANAFGKDEPDVNGDGIVNILDLVVVANAFE